MYLRWFDVSAFVTHFHQKPKPDVVAGQQKVLELEVDTLRNVAGVSARIKIGYKINPKTPLRHPTTNHDHAQNFVKNGICVVR